MRKIHYLTSLIFIIFILSCSKNDKNKHESYNKQLEKHLTLNSDFKIGDIRRYGIFPKDYSIKKYKKRKNLDSILQLSATGLKLYFPTGYFNNYLQIDNLKNVSINFNNTQIGSFLRIKNSEYIQLTGNLISYNMIEINNSKDITADTLQVIDNPDLHSGKKHSSGFQILNKSSELKFKFINIEGLGSGKNYKYIHSALKIYGYPIMPSKINIQKLNVKNSSVHGVLIMGDYITINTLSVKGYGLKDNPFLAKLSNVKQMPQNYYAIWLQKNTNSHYNLISIAQPKKKYMRLGPGTIHKPTVIDTLIIPSKVDLNKKIDDAPNTNIVVRFVIVHEKNK